MTRYVSVHVHLVWAVKGRAPAIDESVRQWLWPALAEKARAVGSGHVVVGGVADHVLAELPAAMPVSELVRRLKGASSRLASHRGVPDLRWQDGYAVFSVSPRDLASVAAYVRNQPEHHGDGSVDSDAELAAAAHSPR